MKDFGPFLLDIAERLRYSSRVEVHINGADIVVAEPQDPGTPFSTIEIEYHSDESAGVLYKIGNSSDTKVSIANYDKSDYFNQNLVSPLILEYEEFKKVLVAFSELDEFYSVKITEVLYEIIKDK